MSRENLKVVPKNGKLEKYTQLPNIAEELDEDTLHEIGNDLFEQFEEDAASRKEWEQTIDDSLELASLKAEEKDFPWEGAANLKYPAITIAAIQFASYTRPEIIRNEKVMGIQVHGYDSDGSKMERAQRLTDFHNYQLLCSSKDWRKSLDSLLHMLPTQGVVYKKLYWDPTLGKIVHDICGYKEVYVNHNIKSLKTARRITHKMIKHKNELVTKIRQGLYLDVDLIKNQEEPVEKHATSYTENLDDNEFEVLEMHCYLDLDDDGYEEPYVVTFLGETQDVLRIAARYSPESIKRNKKGEVYYIEPDHYFVDYHYIPDFNGKYHSQSCSSLLFAYNKGINTVLNQLINAGTLSTTQGGFLGKSARVRGGKIYLQPGEWIKCDSASDVDLRKAILPMDFKEPSPVLFQLLGFLTDSAKEIANITDVMTGKQNAQNVQSSTIQILAEKGLKAFSNIQNRVYDSLEEEFKMIFALNKKFLTNEEYKKVLDYPGKYDKDDDFNEVDYDISPVANPNLASDMQRMVRAQQEMALISEGGPLAGNQEAAKFILKDYLEALNATHIEEKLAQFAQQQQPPPDPELIKVQADMATEAEKVRQNQQKLDHKKQLDTVKFQLEAKEKEADIELTRAQAMKALAEAQLLGNEQQFNQAQMELEALLKQEELKSRSEDRQLKVQEQQLKREQMEHQTAQSQLQTQADLDKTKYTTDSQHSLEQTKLQHEASMSQQQMSHDQQQADAQRQHDQQQGQDQFTRDMYSKQADHQFQDQSDQQARQHESQSKERDLAYDQYDKSQDRSYDYVKHRETQEHEQRSQKQQHKSDKDLAAAKARDTGVAKPPGKPKPNGSN
jgi:chaperonin GroES